MLLNSKLDFVYLCMSSDLLEKTVESSPNVTVNSIDDGVSGLLSNIENHIIGNIIIINIASIIPPPTHSLNIQDTCIPRLLSNNSRKLFMLYKHK